MIFSMISIAKMSRMRVFSVMVGAGRGREGPGMDPTFHMILFLSDRRAFIRADYDFPCVTEVIGKIEVLVERKAS